MQSTGQTTTQAVSFTPMQGLVMTYATITPWEAGRSGRLGQDRNLEIGALRFQDIFVSCDITFIYMLNLHHLAIFSAVAQTRSFSRGSERLMISQPAVS